MPLLCANQRPLRVHDLVTHFIVQRLVFKVDGQRHHLRQALNLLRKRMIAETRPRAVGYGKERLPRRGACSKVPNLAFDLSLANIQDSHTAPKMTNRTFNLSVFASRNLEICELRIGAFDTCSRGFPSHRLYSEENSAPGTQKEREVS